MRKRRLGNSDMELTALGFGAWAIGGGGWAFAWGAQDDAQSIEAIQRALDSGINWIDTAAVYGLGHSEDVVARALKGRDKRPYVFTKCGMVWDEQGKVSRRLKADSVREECEASLRRLKVDAIDLYQVHWPVEDGAELEEGWTALAELQRQGKVRWLGVSNFNVSQLEQVRRIAPVTSLQPQYSLIHRDIEDDLLPYCQAQGIGVIVYSPMASGLLTGAMTRERILAMPDDDWRRGSADFQEPKLSHHLSLVERMREVGARHGRSPAEVALAWTLRGPAVTAAIVGARSAKQVDGFIHAGDFRLTSEEVREVEEVLGSGSAMAPGGIYA
ncbi:MULTISPECIES: aldo/keto reductase [unclassified Corallococcus]|uniref:aldo/keto reductase n=1 Tax=unclassified Corallococcus TaxID=2685029 RepID=UPI001A8D1C0D|nr:MULTISPECIES: aldo/keto reductase [unclassified Corallococcus]MBN9681427.1 aldo/keto reductase [Corallococcus sp. NCSPR001]WAS86995.1 aldo/keto reductase [Corallococcus sp. NCRR]